MGRIKDQIIKGGGAELGSLFLWKNKKEDIKQKRIFICGSADYFLLRPGTPNIPPPIHPLVSVPLPEEILWL